MKNLVGGFAWGHLVATLVALGCVHCGDDSNPSSPEAMGGGGGETSTEGGSDGQQSMAGAGNVGQAGTDGTGSGDGGSGGDGNGAEGGTAGAAPVEVHGDHYGFVFSEVKMPSTNPQAAALAFDLNGDDEPENQFGKAMSALATQGFDINGGIAQKVQDGSVIMLADLQAEALTDAEGVGLATYYGSDPEPAPCTTISDCGHHLDGSGSFSIANDSPPTTQAEGSILAASFNGAGGALPFKFGFAGGVLELVLNDARAELGELSEDGFTGRIGGYIPGEQVDSEIFPSLHTAFSGIVAADCTGGAWPDCGCAESSTGKTYLTLLDADHDCSLILSEVKESPTLQTFFALDLDTDGDQEPDAMSCAFAVKGKKGTFDLP